MMYLRDDGSSNYSPLDDLGGVETLLRVEVGGRLVNEVDISRLTQT